MRKKIKTIVSACLGLSNKIIANSDENAFVGGSIFLFAIAFATSSAGSFIPAFEFCLYTIFTIWFLIKRQTPFLSLLSAFVGMLIFCAVVPTEANRWVGLWHIIIGLGIAELGTRYCHKRSEGNSADSFSCSLNNYIFIVAILLIFDIVAFGNPVVRPGIDYLCREMSIFLTGFGGRIALPLGATYWSVPVLIAYLLLAVFQPNWQRKLFMMCGLILAVVIYFAILEPLQVYAMSTSPIRSLSSWYERANNQFQLQTEPINWQYIINWLNIYRPQTILIAILAIVNVLACRFWKLSGKQETNTAKKNVFLSTNFIIPACLGLIIGGLICWRTLPRVVSQSDLLNRKVAIMTSNLGMKIPVHGYYGYKSVGMFGRMPGVIRSYGLVVDEIGTIAQLHNDHEILIVANLQDNFSEIDKQKIWNWVKNGGGLLVLTDHTGNKGLRLPTNDLLQPFGLEANFDSAKLFSVDGGFDYEMWMGSPLTAIRGARWRGAQQYGTGASITAYGQAIPIMQARYAYVDPGSFTEVSNGNLGNLKYDIGEKLGDVMVGGFSRLGEGRAILFGDTSPFQNGATVSSHEFIRQILGMLLPSGPTPQYHCWSSGILGLIGASLLAFYSLKRNKSAVIIFSFMMTLAWGGGWAFAYEYPKPLDIHSDKAAIIDISNCPYVGLQDWTPTDLTGLTTCLMREGYSPICVDGSLESQLTKTGENDALFLVCPLWKISKNDKKGINDFMQRGGTVVVNCGFEQAENVNMLLKEFNIQISDTTLGATPDDEAQDPNHIHFLNAWQIKGDGKVLFSLKGRPVVLAKQIGKGKLIVIGDSKFFWDINIESQENYRPGNINFLKQLLNLSINDCR